MRMRTLIGRALPTILLSAACCLPAQAQLRLDAPGASADQILDTARPRIAVAPDGSFAIAWEAYRQSTTLDEWQIAVQRFSPTGEPVGPPYFFGGESCSGIDIWTSDWMEHVELAYQPNGTLLLLMTHSGDYSLGGIDHISTSESTLAAIDASGQVIDLSNSESCVQRKLYFEGTGRQLRARMDVSPEGAILIALDGRFDTAQGEATASNVAVRILAPDGSEVVSQYTPHDDPGSAQAYHSYADIATNGRLILSVWNACPYDGRGDIVDCDIGAQFVSYTNGTFQAVGGNVRVNAGDPAGTLNIWPSAAMNGAGNSVVVWADTRTGLQGDVFAQRYDASGQAVGANVQVSTGQGEIYTRPEVALLEDGRFMVVWTDSSAVGFRARGRLFDANGNALAPPFELSGGGTLETGSPAVTPYGNTYLYTWLGGRRGEAAAVFSNNLGLVVSKETPAEVPVTPSLLESYPNPFTRTNTIRYVLPEAAAVRLAVYDLLGREVTRLVDQTQPPGAYTVTFDAGPLPAGPYLLRLQHGGRTTTRLVMRVE